MVTWNCHEAMIDIVHVSVVSRNRTEVVDAGRPSKDRTGRIDRRDITVGTTQIAVEHTICVDIGSHDSFKVVEARRTIGRTPRPLKAASARAGSIEGLKRTVGAA